MADFKTNPNNYIVLDNNLSKIVIKSKTYGTIECLVDTDNIKVLKERIWSVAKRESVKSKYYIQSNKRELLHRFITNCPKGMVIDHINGNTLDNRILNLRICNHSINNTNRLGYGTCKYKYMSKNSKRVGHNESYTVKFPNLKRRTFTNINNAKAYYIECLMNGGEIYVERLQLLPE